MSISNNQTIHSQHKQRFNVRQQVTQRLIVTKRVPYQSENTDVFNC